LNYNNRHKLKTTEEQIAKVQEKINQLTKERDMLNPNYLNQNLANHFKERDHGSRTPWASYGVRLCRFLFITF
jgi:hypothetical protein